MTSLSVGRIVGRVIDIERASVYPSIYLAAKFADLFQEPLSILWEVETNSRRPDASM